MITPDPLGIFASEGNTNAVIVIWRHVSDVMILYRQRAELLDYYFPFGVLDLILSFTLCLVYVGWCQHLVNVSSVCRAPLSDVMLYALKEWAGNSYCCADEGVGDLIQSSNITVVWRASCTQRWILKGHPSHWPLCRESSITSLHLPQQWTLCTHRCYWCNF